MMVFSAIASANDLPSGPPWVTCECEQSSCGACEIETGVSFYSAKCGVNNAKVKSCKKPSCEPVENQKKCLADLKGAPKTESELERRPAARAYTGPEAGEIVEVAGSVKVTKSGGEVETGRYKTKLHLGDLIETGPAGRVKVQLRDLSEIIIAPSTHLRLDQVTVEKASSKRQIMLNLLKGKVRSKVTGAYNDENYFRVKTKAAVAGVRGTEFITSFEPGAEQWVSEVRTISGIVRLEKPELKGTLAALRPGDANPAETMIDVPGGTFAKITVEAPPRGATEDEMIKMIAEKATLSPLYKINDNDMKMLRESVEFLPAEARADNGSSRSIASTSNDEVICTEPIARYNQCSWTCEGNPKGEKKCRTDMEGVKCVRRLCRANGTWGDAKRLPASESESCKNVPVVKDCGAYW
jgi:hypothetical protein